jgi:hypothetical protein
LHIITDEKKIECKKEKSKTVMFVDRETLGKPTIGLAVKIVLCRVLVHIFSPEKKSVDDRKKKQNKQN